jgi:hypothetical protein
MRILVVDGPGARCPSLNSFSIFCRAGLYRNALLACLSYELSAVCTHRNVARNKLRLNALEDVLFIVSHAFLPGQINANRGFRHMKDIDPRFIPTIVKDGSEIHGFGLKGVWSFLVYAYM